MRMRRYIGIDPGINHTGVAVWTVEDDGRITLETKTLRGLPPRKHTLTERIAHMSNSLNETLSGYENVSLIVIEMLPPYLRHNLSRNVNTDSIRKLALVTGALIATASQYARVIGHTAPHGRGRRRKGLVTKEGAKGFLSAVGVERAKLNEMDSHQADAAVLGWWGMTKEERDGLTER